MFISSLYVCYRFATYFKQHGFKAGDTIHLVVGNYNLCYSACFGAWILGGIPSVGDINLEAAAIARQVCRLVPMSFS
jgi:hypothetical protein